MQDGQFCIGYGTTCHQAKSRNACQESFHWFSPKWNLCGIVAPDPQAVKEVVGRAYKFACRRLFNWTYNTHRRRVADLTPWCRTGITPSC
ncbi:hypothetical protein GCM10007927_23400 [Sulfitobacter pacificus]|uniref:Uncharacterized protein n=1 Tax=Sulfitobacter pacificus TaxID=1499314 RepID=A0ABQ5VKI0_9RHOB|nr:hypothetical protein GCM10007927_23400 [Sulfitobacter pacificus]